MLETSANIDKVECEVCNDSGWIIEGRAARRCDCMAKKIAKAKSADVVARSGLKGLLLTKSFETFKPRNKSQKIALEKVRKGGSFFIMGMFGLGKTHLLAASANDAVAKGVDVAFFSVPWLLQMIRDDLLSNRPIGVLEQVTQVSYLCLDDLGKEKATETVQEKLFMIVDQREIAGLRTSVTSNYDPDTLAHERVDGSIVDRICGMCELIVLEGDSFRRR